MNYSASRVKLMFAATVVTVSVMGTFICMHGNGYDNNLNECINSRNYCEVRLTLNTGYCSRSTDWSI